MSQVEPAPIPHRGTGPVLTFGITGANGFVGSNLCRHLLAAGHRVQALVRTGADRRFIAHLPDLRIHEGALGDAASLQRAFAGCAVIVHAAARTADWGAWEQFEAANIRGVSAVLAAARATGVRRVVHLSTVSVYGFPGLVDVTEDQPWLARPRDAYISSKQQGEHLARAAHGADLEVAVLRPGGLYGPNDRVTSAPLFAALEHGRLPLVDRGRHLLAPTYVDNLVQAIWLAATRIEAAGRVYNVTDAGRINWHDYLFAACEDLGCRPPRLSLPSSLALPLAAAVEDVSRWLRPNHMPPLTRYRIRAVMADSHFNCQRARDELGYAPAVATREGLRRTVAWYRA